MIIICPQHGNDKHDNIYIVNDTDQSRMIRIVSILAYKSKSDFNKIPAIYIGAYLYNGTYLYNKKNIAIFRQAGRVNSAAIQINVDIKRT